MRLRLTLTIISFLFALIAPEAKAYTIIFAGSNYITNPVLLQYTVAGSTYSTKAVAAGAYTEDGYHDASNPSYATGLVGSNSIVDFFAFDLQNVSGQIASASLLIPEPVDGYQTSQPVRGFELSSVSTPLPDLIASHEDASDIFADLVNGQVYGSTRVTKASDGKIVRVALNALGLAALNAAEGSDFALAGGAFYIAPTVPLPAAAPLFGAALLALGAVGYGLKRKVAAA